MDQGPHHDNIGEWRDRQSRIQLQMGGWFGPFAGPADGLDGVGREALLDVAADAGTRVRAIGQLALAAAVGRHRRRGSWMLGGGNRNPAVGNPQVASVAGRSWPRLSRGWRR